jgi:hypothetical protein
MTRPDLGTQFLPGDHAIRMLQEIREHAEDFGPRAEDLIGMPQGVTMGVELTLAKAIDHLALPLPPTPRSRTGMVCRESCAR